MPRHSAVLALAAAVAPPSPCAAADPTLNASFLMPTDFTSMHLATWSVNFADVPDEPLMHPENPWDEEIGGKGTILVDPIDGMYKAWYISQPGIDYTTYNSSEGASRMISYATSPDGVTWDRPRLDLVPWQGQPSNILLRLPGGKECDYACVFVDAGARNASRRYEMLALLSAPPPGFPPHHGHVIYRFYAADGIHWSPEGIISRGPCHGGSWCSDSMYINRAADGSYTAILKHGSPSGAPPGGVVPYDIGAGGGRWIFVSNSSDGEAWEPAALALSPDWRDGPGFQVISSISTIQARGGVLVGWLPVFHSLAQTIDMQLCASRDGGRTWWRPERRSAVRFKELGYYGGGMMWPYRLFVPDRDDPTKLHAYFSGCQGRHADIHSTLPGERFAEMRGEWESNGAWGYRNLNLGMEQYSPVRGTNWFRGALMRATWDASRLWALVPSAGGDIPGTAVTAPQGAAAGRALVVNVQVHTQTRSRAPGHLAAELLDAATGRALPGFAMGDCVNVSADARGAPLRWRGGGAAPAGTAELRVRFRLLRARLYSFEWA